MKKQNYIRRDLGIQETLKRKSVLLLGPRQTGKSSFIKNQLKPSRIYNLLDSVTFRNLATSPSLIREELKQGAENFIVIDEIQKLPNLMDEVHLMIEDYGARFLLTGSSARKLRRSYTSLMAGRARQHFCYPLTTFELGDQFNLNRALQFGTLPSVYLSEDPWDDIMGYVGDYLKEEILAEALSRNIESFARFLQTAAVSNGEILNFEKIGQDAQVPPRTIREYYSILEDTLIGQSVLPFQKKKGRKTVTKSKFYFFDLGVVNSLVDRKTLSSKTRDYGMLFETWVYLELKAYRAYRKKDETITFWRTQLGQEVDFVIGDSTAIEVKSTSLAHENDISGLRALDEEVTLKRKILVTCDARERKIGGVHVLPYGVFVSKLWNGDLY
jgi:predicted AAA+ superfamily ATPase